MKTPPFRGGRGCGSRTGAPAARDASPSHPDWGWSSPAPEGRPQVGWRVTRGTWGMWQGSAHVGNAALAAELGGAKRGSLLPAARLPGSAGQSWGSQPGGSPGLRARLLERAASRSLRRVPPRWGPRSVLGTAARAQAQRGLAAGFRPRPCGSSPTPRRGRERKFETVRRTRVGGPIQTKCVSETRRAAPRRVGKGRAKATLTGDLESDRIWADFRFVFGGVCVPAVCFVLLVG